MGVLLVSNQAPGIAVPHPEQTGTQYPIATKERDQKVEHQFEENMDRSPKQLMVMSYGVFFQWWFFELPLGPPCALEIDMS